MIRIGQGYDVHAFTDGDSLVLAGVRIPFHKAFLAHSDGDVLLHAIADALLGAAALGDIGRLFPDTDPAFAGIDSRVLLRDVAKRVKHCGFTINNIDATIVAQAPRMAPHIDAMCHNIATDLRLDIQAVNVKATTTEHLGFCGREEGIAAFASTILATKLGT